MNILSRDAIFKAIFSLFLLLGFIRISHCSQIAALKYRRGSLELVEATYKSKFLLPCMKSEGETVNSTEVILLYFKTYGTPIFTADARNGSISTAKIWSKYYLNGRLQLGRLKDKFGIWIDNVSFNESGIYTCRVISNHSPTKDTTITLRVIDPLKGLEVYDGHNNKLINGSTVGPFQLGQIVRYKCVAIGGRPSPRIRWKINDEIIKSKRRRGKRKSYKIIDVKLSRQSLGTILTCEATNSKFGDNFVFHLRLDVILPPLAASIAGAGSYPSIKNGPKILTMKEGFDRNLTCNVIGSYPSTQVVWKSEMGSNCAKEERKLQVMKLDIVQDGSSFLQIKPQTGDNGVEIVCHAFNPLMGDVAVTDIVKLNILFAPQIKLKPMTNLDVAHIRPRTNVFLQCDVAANPPTRHTIWFHENKQIVSGKKYIMSETELLLLDVNKTHAGKYFCESSNLIGKSKSNVLTVKITHRPECLEAGSLKIPKTGEVVYLSCQVSSNPPVNHYRWYDRSRGYKLLATTSENTLKINRSQQTGRYIDCYAENDIGLSPNPCQFEIINKEHELDTLSKCDIFEEGFGEKRMMVFSCLPQKPISGGFIFEIYTYTNSSVRTLLQKQTSSVPLHFIKGLLPGRKYRLEVYSISGNKQSAPLALSFTVPKEMKNSPTTKSQQDFVLVNFIPLLALIIGILLIVIICTCVAADTIASTYMKWKHTNDWLRHRYLRIKDYEQFDDGNSYIIGGRMILGKKFKREFLCYDYKHGNYVDINSDMGSNAEENYYVAGSRIGSSQDITFELKETFPPDSSSPSNSSNESEFSSDVSTVIYNPRKT